MKFKRNAAIEIKDQVESFKCKRFPEFKFVTEGVVFNPGILLWIRKAINVVIILRRTSYHCGTADIDPLYEFGHVFDGFGFFLERIEVTNNCTNSKIVRPFAFILVLSHQNTTQDFVLKGLNATPENLCFSGHFRNFCNGKLEILEMGVTAACCKKLKAL